MQSSLSASFPVSRFSTDGLPSADRLDAWQGMISQAYDIGARRSDFHGAIEMVAMDRMVLHTMNTAPQSVARTKAHVQRDGFAHFSLHLSGSGYAFEHGGTEGRLDRGGISVNDLSRPFRRSASPERNSIILSLSRELVESAIPEAEALHGTVLRAEPAKLMREHMRMLAARVPHISAKAGQALANASAAMLAACLSAHENTSKAVVPALNAALVLRAKRHIRAELHSAELTPDSVARAIGVSRRRLFSLLEPEGGVERYIRNRRLGAAADALRDPRDRRSISVLAHDCGFASASHFTRAFRERFGMTAGDMREGFADCDWSGAEAAQSAFIVWLRALG